MRNVFDRSLPGEGRHRAMSSRALIAANDDDPPDPPPAAGARIPRLGSMTQAHGVFAICRSPPLQPHAA